MTDKIEWWKGKGEGREIKKMRRERKRKINKIEAKD